MDVCIYTKKLLKGSFGNYHHVKLIVLYEFYIVMLGKM